jgi:excisionase family DNA binding protein
MTKVETFSEPNNERNTFLSRAQVGQLLNIHPHTVDKYAKDGLFPKYTIGRHVRFKYSEVINAVCGVNTSAV